MADWSHRICAPLMLETPKWSTLPAARSAWSRPRHFLGFHEWIGTVQKQDIKLLDPEPRERAVTEAVIHAADAS